MYQRFCRCVQRMQRRHCTSWVLAAMSHKSLFASHLASSPFPLKRRASTSDFSWTHRYDGYERKTPAYLLLVRLFINHAAIGYLCRVNFMILFAIRWNNSGIKYQILIIFSAGRFRQVQVLTAMANAFYSLYSHVSRTPLQKLATPEFTFSSPVERIERFRSSVRSEPRSPVERLKDTVSKMCLYTGSPRGSDSTSPQSSPRKRASLPDVVGAVLKVRPAASKNLDLGEYNRSNSAADVRLITDDDKTSNLESEEQKQQIVVDVDILPNINKIFQMDLKNSKPIDKADTDENIINPTDSESRTHSIRTSLASSLSGETVIETDYQFLSCQPELDSCSGQSDARTADPKPAAKVTYDLICPQIVESVHQAPFCCQCRHNLKTDTFPPSFFSETENTATSSPGLYKSNKQICTSDPDEDSCTAASASSGGTAQVDASGSFSVLTSSGSYTHYYITVTQSESDIASSCTLRTPDSSNTSTVPPIQTCEESFNEGISQYLNPLTHQGSSNLQQVNSFELEEVW